MIHILWFPVCKKKKKKPRVAQQLFTDCTVREKKSSSDVGLKPLSPRLCLTAAWVSKHLDEIESEEVQQTVEGPFRFLADKKVRLTPAWWSLSHRPQFIFWEPSDSLHFPETIPAFFINFFCKRSSNYTHTPHTHGSCLLFIAVLILRTVYILWHKSKKK